MGIRSEVGVAVHSDLVEKVEAACPWLPKESTVHEREGHKLYLMPHVKWYPTDEGIKALYDVLGDEDSEKFLVLEASNEYPPDPDGNMEMDLGCWYDNPWSLVRVVDVSLSYEE
jgi:hypothetical protein